MAIQIDNSEFIISKNENGYYQTVINNKIDDASMQITVMFDDRNEFDDGTIIKVEHGFLTYIVANAYGVFHKIKKRWYPHLMPQVRISKYKILGNANQFATKE